MNTSHPLVNPFSLIPQCLLNCLLHPTSVTTIAGGLFIWLGIARAMRWYRYNDIHRKYGPKWNNGLGTINPQEAQEIMHLSTVYDMPLLLDNALSLALFKTYGIPSISKLLAATKELSSADRVSRRYSDTIILISTWHICPISGFMDPTFSLTNKGLNAKPAEDPRANIALARVNWLHSKYKISNSDYLYTLCLFALEPISWSDRYGWRSLSPLEKHAFYVFWVEIGRKMNIQDLPGSLEEMMAWSKEYEATHMVPAQSNRAVADYTVDELLYPVPNILGLKAFGVRVVVSFLDTLTREATMYQKQPWLLCAALNGSMAIVAFFQRFLPLPRISGSYAVEIGPPKRRKPGQCHRMHPTGYAARSWYKPESSSTVGYCTDKLLVKLGWYQGMPSHQLKSEGYRLEEIGPAKYENAGHKEIMRSAEKLQGCPIVGPWSLEGREGTF